MTMTELFAVYERVTGVAAPRRKIPGAVLVAIAAASELGAKLTGKPVLLSMAMVKLMLREAERTHFDHAKSERELGLTLRPVEDTLRDEVAWFRTNGFVSSNTGAA